MPNAARTLLSAEKVAGAIIGLCEFVNWHDDSQNDLVDDRVLGGEPAGLVEDDPRLPGLTCEKRAVSENRWHASRLDQNHFTCHDGFSMGLSPGDQALSYCDCVTKDYVRAALRSILILTGGGYVDKSPQVCGVIYTEAGL